MKKMILGLFLTVGVSGFALAGNSKLNEEKQVEDNANVDKVQKSNEEISTLDRLEFEKLFNCYYVTKMRFDFDGYVMYTTVSSESSPCVNGDEDGTIGITVIDAW